MSQFDSILKKLESNKAVKLVVVFSKENEILHPVKTKENSKTLEKLTTTVVPLISKAKILVRNIDYTNDLTFIHFKAGKEEILIAPGDDECLVVLADIGKLDI